MYKAVRVDTGAVLASNTNDSQWVIDRARELMMDNDEINTVEVRKIVAHLEREYLPIKVTVYGD